MEQQPVRRGILRVIGIQLHPASSGVFHACDDVFGGGENTERGRKKEREGEGEKVRKRQRGGEEGGRVHVQVTRVPGTPGLTDAPSIERYDV